MRYFILTFCLLLTQFPAIHAQINKGKKLVSKGEYEQAIEAFENALEEYSNKPIALEELAKIYGTTSFEGFDIEKAYQYITRALKEYNGLNSTNRKKAQSKGASKLSMTKYQSDLAIKATQLVETEKDLAKANRFLKIYKTASQRQVENITKLRDQLAFDAANAQNTFVAFEDFFKKYEISCEQYNRDLLIKAQKKLLETYIAEKEWKMYPAFEEQYKDNVYVKDSKAAYALIKIIRKKSLKEYQKFTEAYPHSPFNKFAKDYMFDIIMQGTNLPDYDYFVRAYPKYEKSEKIWLRFYRLYLQEHGQDAVQEFAKAYPQYPFQEAIKSDSQEAQNNRDKPIFEKARDSKDIISMLDFIAQSPSSPYVLELEQPMFKALQKKSLFRGCKTFLKLYPNSEHYDAVLDMLYDRYVQDGELVTINQFMMEYPEYKDVDKQQRDLKLAEQGAELKLTTTFQSEWYQQYETFIRDAAPKERAFIALQRILETDIQEGNWDSALEKINHLSAFFGRNNPRIENLKQILASKSPNLKKAPMSAAINSSAHEYIPLISLNNKYLYFCRLDKNSTGLEDENIYVSGFKDGEWHEAKYIKGLNTSSNNEGPLAISPDNQHIIIFKGNVRNGDMFISDYSSKGWSTPKPLPNHINSTSWDADAMISSDGQALLFASESEKVLDLRLDDNPTGFHGRNIGTGNRDIFVSLKGADGEWQEPINLGDVINTRYVERTPFLHPDMKTLYFSSDGHGGLGRLDVFMTTRLDDTWTNWSKPVNLGKSINTPQNDWGYRISTDGKTAYFAATNQDQNEDIFMIEVPREFRPKLVSTVTGFLSDMDGNPLSAEIIWEDMATGEEIGRLKSDPKTGEFFIALPNDRQYSYFVFKEGYFPKSDHLDLRNAAGTTIDVSEQLSVFKIDEMIEFDISLPLKNLFFEANQYTIDPTSYLELDRLVELIKKDELKVKISGHTDKTGNAKENITLSQKRAEAVQQYLIKQGCDPSTIEAKGFGSSKPLSTDNTEEGKQLNRRVEVRFIK